MRFGIGRTGAYGDAHMPFSWDAAPECRCIPAWNLTNEKAK